MGLAEGRFFPFAALLEAVVLLPGFALVFELGFELGLDFAEEVPDFVVEDDLLEDEAL